MLRGQRARSSPLTPHRHYGQSWSARPFVQTTEAVLKRGHRALKPEVGFGGEIDMANLAAMRAIVGTGMRATDVDRGWSIAQALEMMPRRTEFDLRCRRSRSAPTGHGRNGTGCARGRQRRSPLARTLRAWRDSRKPSRKMCSAWFSPTSRNEVSLAPVPGSRAIF